MFPTECGKKLTHKITGERRGNEMNTAKQVLDLIEAWGGIDGGHHKQWLLNEIVKAITKDGYEKWVREYEDGEDGPKTYFWDTGIAP